MPGACTGYRSIHLAAGIHDIVFKKKANLALLCATIIHLKRGYTAISLSMASFVKLCFG